MNSADHTKKIGGEFRKVRKKDKYFLSLYLKTSAALCIFQTGISHSRVNGEVSYDQNLQVEKATSQEKVSLHL